MTTTTNLRWRLIEWLRSWDIRPLHGELLIDALQAFEGRPPRKQG